MPFKKGHTGNPNGRPRIHSDKIPTPRELIEHKLEFSKKLFCTVAKDADRIIKQLIDEALGGNLKALMFIVENCMHRMHGMTFSDEVEGAIQELTTKELHGRLEELAEARKQLMNKKEKRNE